MSAYRSLILRFGFLVVLIAGIMFLASTPVHANGCTAQCQTTFLQCEAACNGDQTCITICRNAFWGCIACCEDPTCTP